MDLSVVILNWNAYVDTIRCVTAVSAWRQVKATIWVVDNGSTDGSADMIARECPDVHLVRNTTNLGFGGGNNKGIVRALKTGNWPVLLLNNDAIVEEQDVYRLLNTLQENRTIAFIGPVLYDAEQPDRLLSAGGRDPALHHHGHIFKPPPDQQVSYVDYVPGTVMIGSAEVFGDVGLFDEDYFFNIEAADLCMRARRRGFVCAIDTHARAFHALDRRPSRLRETLYVYYVVRNRFLYIRKFFGWSLFPLAAFWAFYSLALFAKLWISGNRSMAQSVRIALADGLLGRFGGQNERVLKLLEK